MKRFMPWLAVLVLVSGVAFAEELVKYRFDVSAGMGFPTVLSGPSLSNSSNLTARFGFYPSEHFMLTFSYFEAKNDIASQDILNTYFAGIYRNNVSESINFNQAELYASTVDINQYQLGIIKGIPIGTGKHWEAYVGIGVGMQDASAVIQWVDATKRITSGPNAGTEEPVDLLVMPSQYTTDNGVFFVSVNGGINYMPVPWLGLNADLRMVPIDKVFDQSLNTLSVNFNVVFRFGKM